MGELIAITIAVDAGTLAHSTGLARIAGANAHWGLYALVLSVALTLAFAWPGVGQILRASPPGTSWPLIFSVPAIAHTTCYVLLCWSAVVLCRPASPPISRDWLAVVAVTSGLCTVLSAFLVLIPVGFWRQLAKAAPLAPVFGLAAALAATIVFSFTRDLGGPWLRLSYNAARAALSLLRRDVVADPAHFILGTKTFVVEIQQPCSGYEGVALMLAFGSAWLWFFRRDFRFPQALLLIPGGMLAIWILNCVRLVVLILIGSAGAEQIALGGFHSQAGWIAFTGMALLFSTVCQKLPGMAAHPLPKSEPATDQTTAFLLPFLAILAAGMIAQAFSAGFEWLYSLRVLSAAAALWFYRRSYRTLSWRAGWEALAAGIAVFLLWIGVEQWVAAGRAPLPMPAALAAASQTARFAWIVSRAAGAVVTVPIAEELAFRGYLLRRLVSADFTKVDPRRFALLPFAVSSILFGLLHGQRWIAGTLAGLLYAWAFQRRGRIGDAVLAHALTNALLAAWVLFTGNWTYW